MMLIISKFLNSEYKNNFCITCFKLDPFKIPFPSTLLLYLQSRSPINTFSNYFKTLVFKRKTRQYLLIVFMLLITLLYL